MEYLALDSLIEKPISGEWGTGDGDVNVIRSANFTNHGRINFDKIVARNIPDDKVKTKKLQEEDIIIEKSGGSPTQPVGRVVFFDKKGTYLCSNFTSILRPLKQYVAPKYLHYILFCNHKFGFVEKYQNKTTGIINLQLQKYLKNTKIPLPPLAEQQKIASILDAADSLRQKDQQLIEKYTALSQSLFLEMFGDPKVNPNNWPLTALGKIIEEGPQNGLYKPSGDYGTGTPIIRIDSFHNSVVELSKLKRVRVSEGELSKFEIFEGDFVLNRVNSPSHLGKCGLVSKVKERMVFESNMMRIKFNKSMVNNTFMLSILSSKYLKHQILNSSKDAVNQSSINQKDVNSFEIPLPPIELQNQFAELIQAIEAQKKQAQASLEKSAALFNSLLQRAFKGELTT